MSKGEPASDDVSADFSGVPVSQSRLERGRVAAEISRQMVRLLSRYTGRGPTRARTTLNTNLAVTVFHEALTKAELNLAAAGQTEAVHHMRRTFQALMREQAIDVIEQTTGRVVVAHLSDVDPEANIAAELFIFEPVPEDGIVGTHPAEAADGWMAAPGSRCRSS
jgi:uncharacterized protein YbcI